jgi:type II secretory pathway pseudopilin PulG
MNRSRKDVSMMIVIGVLLVFAMYNFLFRPQGTELSSARSQHQSIEQKIADAQRVLQAPVDTAATGSDPAAKPSAVPEDPAVSQLLRQLQTAADQTGVTLAAINPAPLGANPQGPGGSVQIAITASGPHESIRAYVAALRDLDRLLVVEGFGDDVQPAADQAVQTDQLQLAVRVFTLRAPAGAVVTTTVPLKP